MIPQVILQEKREKKVVLLRPESSVNSHVNCPAVPKKKKIEISGHQELRRRGMLRLARPALHAEQHASSYFLKHKKSCSRSWSVPGPVRELESPMLVSLSSTLGLLHPGISCGVSATEVFAVCSICGGGFPAMVVSMQRVKCTLDGCRKYY